MADIHLKPIAWFKIFGSICKIEPATKKKQELLVQARPQAGAWERENNPKSSLG